MQRTVLIANPKGGAGKTTLSTNLAGYFANKGRATAICDMDRQQSAIRWLGFRQEAMAPISGFYAGNQIIPNAPADAERVVVDAPAGFMGYKLNDFLRRADKVLIPVSPSVFDMAATEDFLNSIRNDIRGRRDKVGIVAMRVDPRTKAAGMLNEFLDHFDLPIVAYLRNTQNYVNVATAGASIFDQPRAKFRRDTDDWLSLVEWVEA